MVETALLKRLGWKVLCEGRRKNKKENNNFIYILSNLIHVRIFLWNFVSPNFFIANLCLNSQRGEPYFFSSLWNFITILFLHFTTKLYFTGTLCFHSEPRKFSFNESNFSSYLGNFSTKNKSTNLIKISLFNMEQNFDLRFLFALWANLANKILPSICINCREKVYEVNIIF